MEEKKSLSGYTSRFGIICVLIGGSVGTGNLWRYPRLAGQHGGAFIIVTVICVFLWALPLMYTENFLGRATRHSAPGAFMDVGGPKYTWFGMFAMAAYMLQTAYYIVVLTWCVHYSGMSLFKTYYGQDKMAVFQDVTNGNPRTIIIWLVLLVLLYFGTRKQANLERISMILLPTLFVILIFLVIYGLTRPGATEGLKFAFRFDPKDLLDVTNWKEGVTQVVWSIGPGTMMIVAAAAVSGKDQDIVLNSRIQAFGDMTAASLGTLCVLPIVFAYTASSSEAMEICASGSNGLTFISLTGMFENMPAGNIVGMLFFLCLSFAAFSSLTLMSMIGVTVFIDLGFTRKQGTLFIMIFFAIAGIPSVLSESFLTNQDNVWGFGLIWGAIFLGLIAKKFGAEKMRTKFLNPVSDQKIGKYFDIGATYIGPIMIGAVLLIWMIESVGWTDHPWALISESSTGTILYQWIALAVICKIACKPFMKHVKHKYYNGESYPDMPENLL
jgi:NSS family neurotransmitter:Na+ symporter